ncbi:MAG: tripartite tricarboxylate transporter substrate binding protein [Burkholderiales bacterium]|nr:tripartite tricarboxylate transporter substrate binding protein [Burkholderiales bacterium]
MRSALRVTLLVAASLLATPAFAQQPSWPARPVQIVVPLAAGGTADGTARVLAERLSTMWPQRVYVENKPGGNTIIGTDAVAKAKPDGYTLGLGIITSQAANQFLFNELPYDTERDFTPLALLAISPIFLIVHPSVPASNLQEFIAYAKSNPDKLSYATTGYGSSFHIATEQFMTRVGIQMVHVPYKGMGVAVVDLLAGTVQVALDVSTMAQVRQGKLKVLGVVGDKRFEGAPSVPSFAEQGVTGLEVSTWLSLHAPAHLDRDIQRRINADVNRVLKVPDVRQKLLAMNYVAAGGSPEDLTAFLVSERKKIGGIIKARNIKLQQ